MKKWLAGVIAWFKAAANLAWIVLSALGLALVAMWVARKRGAAEGKAKGRAEADRERVREADAEGDDDAVLKEWRRHR